MLRSLAVAVMTIVVVSSCSDDGAPSPGGTGSDRGVVLAPNGTNMGATPINAGTSP
jgi:hypothetical protein